LFYTQFALLSLIIQWYSSLEKAIKGFNLIAKQI